MDKRELVKQLIQQVRAAVAVAEREMVAAADAVAHGADAKAKREDARMAIEFGGLARGQRKQAARARQILDAVESWHPQPFAGDAAIDVGALVEIEDEDNGTGRTIFLAPAGAGIELTGPGGDGFFTVVTPSSPIGRAVLGQHVGDSFDVTVNGETRSWEITWLA